MDCPHLGNFTYNYLDSYQRAFHRADHHCFHCRGDPQYIWVCSVLFGEEPCTEVVCHSCFSEHCRYHQGNCIFITKADFYCCECSDFFPITDRAYLSHQASRSLSAQNPGLVKLKNCCYINSTIQVLASVYDFAHFFKTQCYFPSNSESSSLEHEFIREFAELITKLRSYSFEIYNPERLYTLLAVMLPDFKIQIRQDCHEFMSLLFDRLHSSLELTGHLRNIIKDCFEGSFEEFYTCSACNYLSSSEAAFEVLCVPSIDRERASRVQSMLNGGADPPKKRKKNFWTRMTEAVSSAVCSSQVDISECLASFIQPETVDDL
mmetsp:Transcript_7992/g.15713  ORF Transcript_7992/g.15713 Transcript_7992/m.15713 type:complete len:320 (+) Transcript_7992:1374-2333(+)